MAEKNNLLVIWSSADREVALHPCFMYAHNSKKHGWWEEVRLLVWGPSVELLCRDEELQAGVKAMLDDSVEVFSCKVCCEMFGVEEEMKALGVDVKYAGMPLTEMLKDDWAVLTY